MLAVSFLEKVMPSAAKIGGKALIEIISASSVGAGVVSFVLDKGSSYAKKKIDDAAEKKKADLIQKQAALKAAKEAAEEAIAKDALEVKAELVEEKPKKASKKNK